MEIQGFDNLNLIKRRSEPYDKFFGIMNISREQKARRKHLAFLLEDAIAMWLLYMERRIETGTTSEIADKQQLMYMMYDEIDDKGYFEDVEELDNYVTNFVNETYRSTVENMAKHPNDVVLKDGVSEDGDITLDDVEPYWVSDDRAKFIAENEANTLINTAEYNEAVRDGYTYKVWDVYPDDRVRATHMDVFGTEIPIDEYFDVGEAHMLYPKDVTSLFSTGAEHPEETVNCRCSVRYIRK